MKIVLALASELMHSHVMNNNETVRNFRVSVLSTIDNSVLTVWDRQATSLEALQVQLAGEHWDHTLLIQPA